MRWTASTAVPRRHRRQNALSPFKQTPLNASRAVGRGGGDEVSVVVGQIKFKSNQP